ncbi:replication/maintenance protein RepL [Marinilactibacillus psychrotolerans]|uniref:replication/maintenance protein RepL n=1 Tax=Marinilactibacillus psychrotolerans TaxID=191770 RepID=UPI003889A2DD
MSEFFYKTEKKELVKLLELTGSSHGKVMGFLINKVGKTRSDFPLTIDEIAKKIDMSYSQVQKAIKELEQAKLIKKKYGSIIVSPSLISYGKTDYIKFKKSEFNSYTKNEYKKSKKYILRPKPLLDKDSRTLILGHSLTDPVPFDLDNGNNNVDHVYYNDSYSYFWEFLYNGLTTKETPDIYYERKKLLSEFHIGLYYLYPREIEVVGDKIRKTNKNLPPNNIKDLLLEHPQIDQIICNGEPVYKALCKEINKDKKLHEIKENIVIRLLPSTESIRGRGKINYETYKEEWEEIYDFIVRRDQTRPFPRNNQY